MAGIAGAVLIGVGLLGGAVTGWYVDRSKEFELTAKVSYGLSAIACVFLALVGIHYSCFHLCNESSLTLLLV